MNLGVREWLLYGVMLLFLMVLFVVDIATKHGFTNHVLYAVVVLIATASHHTWMPSVVAGMGTALTVIGMVMSPATSGLPFWMSVGNRTFTIIVLWILVWFAWKRREAQTALQKVNASLEHKVVERTTQLTSVNQTLIMEITERIQTEQALRLSEGRLAGILDIAEDAIIVTDHTRLITSFNHGAAKLFGYYTEEALGHPIDLLLPERFRVHHASHIDTFAGAPESARRMAPQREVFGLKKDGTEFPAEASISKLTVGEHPTFTVIVRDITDRVKTERQLQSLASELMTAQEGERRRIARELHDDINQRLAMLMVAMESLLADPSAMTLHTRECVQALAQRLAKVSDDIRRMAYQFHPSILDDLGLTAALQCMADDWSATTGIRTVTVQEELANSLPRDIALCLYRVTQESLANIMKHARADRVELELTCGGQEVTLSISDTGVGFDPETIEGRHLGLGLVSMRERVRSVGGRFDIQSKPGRGTSIAVQIPLSGASHEETTSSPGR